MRHFLICVSIIVFSINLFAQEKIEVTWYNALDLGIDGKGWTDTKTPYDRLPARAEKAVPEKVWQRGQNSAGLRIPFATDATMVIVRWRLRHPSISSPYLSSMSVAGLDLYYRDGNTWRWAATKPPKIFPETTETFLRGMSPQLREYLLYLPSYNGVEKVEIGVPRGSKFGKAVGGEVKKPIVFYGTSIVQGSSSSRPGMTYVAQLGRRLDMPVINLGFSGLCHMEPALADLLAELDPAMYVIDCLPNMPVKEVAERTVPFVERIRKARPETPIVLVENLRYPQGLWFANVKNSVAAKNKILLTEYTKLKKDGVPNLFYVGSEKLIGGDGEATVDGVHPTDLGFIRIADGLEPVLRNIIEPKTAK